MQMDEQGAISIDTQKLRTAFEGVMAHLEQAVGTRIDLHEDYFFSVPFPEIYEVANLTQPRLTIGQLSESWANLQRTEPDDMVRCRRRSGRW